MESWHTKKKKQFKSTPRAVKKGTHSSDNIEKLSELKYTVELGYNVIEGTEYSVSL